MAPELTPVLFTIHSCRMPGLHGIWLFAEFGTNNVCSHQLCHGRTWLLSASTVSSRKLGATDIDGDGKALENLLESWSTDGGLFLNAVLLMPLGLPTLRDPAFLKDRASFFTGLSWKVEDMPSLRGEALVQVKRAFGFLESTLLADGREWLRKTEKPTLADIHVILKSLLGGPDSDKLCPTQRQKWGRCLSLATMCLMDSSISHLRRTKANLTIRIHLGYKKGEEVMVWPTDSGSTHKDAGTLITLDSKEIVLERKTADTLFDIRVHFPRINFRVVSAANTQTKL
ncbi:conserved hypothetical protein [Microsporum canis CBS 113480]|uniref:DUF7962 domain-containing protein n=1 Tax=Arthroderma otae (strain ATCC MYA-4605 / CBS 113480) TaxID=554155 RepID=C5FVA3_ARTOC|nr:conserved hypothetical protein [Microsporum canis CBS 113480]EEQ33837.1 conserved hypothetical protein [Microsporum canis CBS 113480]